MSCAYSNAMMLMWLKAIDCGVRWSADLQDLPATSAGFPSVKGLHRIRQHSLVCCSIKRNLDCAMMTHLFDVDHCGLVAMWCT